MNYTNISIAKRTLNVAIAEDDEEWLILFAQAANECEIDVNLYFLQDGLQMMHFFDETAGAGIKIDLAILDLKMPRLDGHGVLRMMDETGFIDRIPVVVFTGSADPEDRDLAIANGALACQTKPTNYGQFLAFVSSLPEIVSNQVVDITDRWPRAI